VLGVPTTLYITRYLDGGLLPLLLLVLPWFLMDGQGVYLLTCFSLVFHIEYPDRIGDAVRSRASPREPCFVGSLALPVRP
jgi:hypothetical protein